MPLCGKCNNPMLCSCDTGPQTLGAPVLPCQLKDGALWIHVVDDEGGNVKDAVTLRDGANDMTTKPNGVSAHDPLPAGPYTVALGEQSTDVKALYVLPGGDPLPAAVSPGQITYVGIELKRKA